MEFKNCVTWQEIIQQPSIWREELEIVKNNLKSIGAFIEKVQGKKVKVVFTGAGSSEFVGNTLCSYVNTWPRTVPFVENGELNKPANIIEELTVQYWFEKNDVLNHPNEKDVFKIKNRRKYYNIEEGAVKGKSFKRLHRWRYSPTAAYGNNEVHLHPYLPRRISVAEALAIQSLPKWFELPAELPISKKFKTVGNGVPYLLAYGIADELYKWLVNR